MLETAHYPITREESYLRAISLYKDNERNFEKTKSQDVILEKKDTNQNIINTTQEKINYHIEDNLIGEGTPKEKVARNIEAIKLLKNLEKENRLANTKEQEVLSKYVGWGRTSRCI